MSSLGLRRVGRGQQPVTATEMWKVHCNLPFALLGSEGAKYYRESRFTDILWSYAHSLISLSHIQFGSEFSSHYIMMYCVLIWERCYIFPCILILLSQVKYGLQCTVLLWYTQHRHCLLCCCWYPPPCYGVLLDFSSEFRAECFWTLRQSMIKLH